MKFNALDQTHKKLSQNPELSDHNKDDKVEEEEIKKESYQHGLEYLVKNKNADKKEVFDEVNDFMQELMEET